MIFKGFWRNIDPANWSKTGWKWGQNVVKNLPEAPTNIPDIAYKHARWGGSEEGGEEGSGGGRGGEPWYIYIYIYIYWFFQFFKFWFLMWRRFLVGIQGSRLRRKVRETYKVAPALNIIKNGWQDAEKQTKNETRLKKRRFFVYYIILYNTT